MTSLTRVASTTLIPIVPINSKETQAVPPPAQTSGAETGIVSDMYLLACDVYATFLQVMNCIQQAFYATLKNLDIWMQRQVSGHALPAITKFSRTEMSILKLLAEQAIKGLPPEIGAEQVFHRTNAATLSGIKISSKKETDAPKKWIVYFQPNQAVWEANLAHLIKLHEVTSCNILSYNYPEVGFSSGEVRSQDDLLQAADEIMHSLLDHGVSDKDILMHGFSVGGLVTSVEAEKLSDAGFYPRICNERSALSIPEILHAKAFFFYFFSWILVAYNWTLNAERSLSRLSERTQVLFISNPHDPLMVPAAQAVRIKDRMKAEVTCMEMKPETKPDLQGSINEHARPWSDEEYTEYNMHVRRMLQILG